jgi:hypothetical protein
MVLEYAGNDRPQSESIGPIAEKIGAQFTSLGARRMIIS